MYRWTRWIAAALFCAAASPAWAQPGDAAQDGIYIIFDASNSMWGELPDKSRKIEVAKKVLGDFVGGEFPDRELALRIYGHNRPGDCADTSLVVPFAAPGEAVGPIRTAVGKVTPRGKTPISRSLMAALKDFGARKGDILLISDGIETCDADPCALMEEWRASNVNIRVHVVGFGLDNVAREAMTCVAETSGAKYYDADSADGLAKALTEARQAAMSAPPEPGTPTPVPHEAGYEIKIFATDEAGRSLGVEGTATTDGQAPLAVASHHRNEVVPGTYAMELGVRTANGNLYRPVTAEVAVSEPGVTRLDVKAARPAMVRARFVMDGKDIDGALIDAYQDGAKAFSFRWFDEVFADPGTYEFRSKPNADNDLAVPGTLVGGQDTEIVFALAKTVRVAVSFTLTGGEAVKRNSELWRDGKKIYGIHASNGGRVRPGTYELRAPAALTSVTVPQIVVTAEAEQSFEFPIETGFIAVSYDPAGVYKTKPDRAFIAPAAKSQDRHYANTGKAVAVLPGDYVVQGWQNAGDFDPVAVTVAAGQTVPVMLRPKQTE